MSRNKLIWCLFIFYPFDKAGKDVMFGVVECFWGVSRSSEVVSAFTELAREICKVSQ